MTREQAEADLTDRGLNPVVRNRETDPADADPGTVVDQNPKDGVEVAKGADVTIFIAVEPTTVDRPRPRGMTLSASASSAQRPLASTLGSQTPRSRAPTIEVGPRDPVRARRPASEVGTGFRGRRLRLDRARSR